MNIELLAPAGDIEKITFAFLYGADAVYFGGRDYSLRANAKNFSLEDIASATKLAHSMGKKVYVTVNIVFHNDDLNGLEDYLKYLGSINVDGIISSDIIVFELLNKLNIKTKRIVSTQASVLNHQTALFYKKLGANQLVLAREALKEDIVRIKKETGLEIECFIQGAMCSSISGKCILSNYMTNRDSNRGGCAQICRWVFNEDGEYPFTMTPKDLNMLSRLEEMIDAGVNTFKVEGRMRSIYYIATVILCYRRCFDKIINHTFTGDDEEYYTRILNRCANRDSKVQFFDRFPTVEEQYFNLRDEESNQDFLGLVLDYDGVNHIATIEERNYFKVGDEVEFIGPNIDTTKFVIKDIIDEDGNEVDYANKPKMIIKIHTDVKLHKYDIMRVNLN